MPERAGTAMTSTIGVVGVGELGRALVEGLSAVPSTPRILLSPRGASHVAHLAERFPHVRVCPDNQAVADGAEVLLLAVGPERWREVVQPLRLRPGCLVVSVMAGVSLADLTAALPADVTVVRALPMPSVRDRACLTVLYPPHAAAEELFERMGGCVPVADEAALNVFTAITATVSTHLDFLTTIAAWAVGQGLASDQAERFVRNLFAGAGRDLAGSPVALADLAGVVETPGGLNHRVRTTWFDAASQRRLADTLDALVRDLP